MLRNFIRENKASVVQYILIIAAIAAIIIWFSPKTKFYVSYWTDGSVENIDRGLEGNPLPYTGGPTSRPTGFYVPGGVDGTLKEPTLSTDPGEPFYYYYSDNIRFKAVSNGGVFYTALAPYTCEWEGYNGYTGKNCDPEVVGKYSVGEHTVKVRMCDARGACNKTSISFFVTYKQLGIKIFPAPKKSVYIRNDEISFTGEITGGTADFNIIWKLVDKTKNTEVSYTPGTKKKYAIGEYLIKVTATDKNLPNSTKTETYDFLVVNQSPTKPSISMTPSKADGLSEDKTYSFSASGSTDPDGDSIKYVWENNKSKFSPGEHTVTVWAVDSLGAYSEPATITFTVFQKVEIVASQDLSAPLYYSQPITFTGTTNDPKMDKGVTFEIKYINPDGTMTDLPKDNKYEPGTHEVAVRAVNPDGSYSEWYHYSFTVNFKILEIYGYTPQLKSILEKHGLGKVSVDSYSMTEFNTNSSIDLWKYEMVVFGFGDCYSGCGLSSSEQAKRDLSDSRRNDVLAFGNAGRGVLFTHDTYSLKNFAILHDYAGVDRTKAGISWWQYEDFQLSKMKNGSLVTYPYDLSNDEFWAASTHGSFGTATKDVWFAQDPKNASRSWYIISNNNWIVTLTGHYINRSYPERKLSDIPESEQKLLVNTVFYTSQFRGK